MERDLPIYDIHGTSFIVDVEYLCLEKAGTRNTSVFLSEMKDVGDGYEFEYSLKSACPYWWLMDDDEPVTVKIPPFVKLDPIGMAKKYNVPVEELNGKTDFEIMVNQHDYDLRLNKGVLPTIEILDDKFYVNIDKQMLCLDNSHSDKGISFEVFEIGSKYDIGYCMYLYDPVTKRLQKPDLENLLDYPKAMVAVKLPHLSEMDPIAVNIKNGNPPQHRLKNMDFRLQCTAEVVPWKETNLKPYIDFNREKARREDFNKRLKEVRKNRQRRGKGI